MDNYEIMERIGSGACGAVYLVTSKVNGKYVIGALPILCYDASSLQAACYEEGADGQWKENQN